MMVKSVFIWAMKAVYLTVLTVVSFPLAPIFALFIVYEEEVEITGFPSLLPGTPRAFLAPFIRIWQTPDAPLDEFWYGGYTGWPRDGRTQAEYDSSAWLRYLCRVTWLWRNAAYGFGAKVGYNVKGLVVTRERDEEHLWRTGVNCFSYWIFKNDAGDIGWCVRAQFYYYKRNCLEMYLGYKLPSVTVDGKKFVAIQFTPFRNYPK